MSVIEITDLVKDFQTGFWRKRPVRAVDGLTLSVEQGEVFGFLGPNGAGKTTTLKILMGLLRPTSGSARILGVPVEDVWIRARIGYLPEHPYFYDYLTAAEFLSYMGRLLGLRGPELDRRVDSLLTRVGLAHVRKLQLRKFSKGMIQRIGIAQAIINDPEVVFLDEPMSGLDPLGRREVREVIASLRARNVTVFFSSHILPDVEALCDRVAILNRGKLQQVGALHEILRVETSGYEVMLAHVSGRTRERLIEVSSSHVTLGDRLQLGAGTSAQLREILSQAVAAGAEFISVNPIRASLEDHFFQEIARQPGAALDEAEAALQGHE